MRPTRLVMEGFGPYRAPTTVDFDGVDLFALSGPTGAGKSSVIDAICMALYGSVPRYENRNLVAPVISQGLTSAKVHLEFTIGGVAHSATRVIRRTAGGASTREARLQRGDEVLAGSAPEVTAAVSELLGLSFEHFTRCIVLPQGDFARFLHDPPRDRQDLVKRLLDITIYERVAVLARARAAAAAGDRAAAIEVLGELSDATPEAVAAAHERARVLGDLLDQVRAELNDVASIEAAAAEAETAIAARRGVVAELRSVRPPDGLAAHDRELAAATAHVSAGERAIEAAQAEVAQARAALAALGTDDALRSAIALHERLEMVEHATAAAVAVQVARCDALAAAEQQVAVLVAELQVATDELASAESARTRAADELARVSAVVAPHDVATLQSELDAATHEVSAAEADAAAADAAARHRADELAALGDVAAVERSLHAHQRAAQLTLTLADHTAAVSAAVAAAASAAAAHDAAERQAAAARAAHEEAVVHDQAGALRSHLVAGAPCPVCEQIVAELPGGDRASGVRAAKAAVKRAEAEVAATAKAVAAADHEVASLTARRDAIAEQLADAQREAGSVPERALALQLSEIASARSSLESARAEVEGAAERLRAARSRRDALEPRRAAAERALATAAAAVAEVVEIGELPDGLEAGWAALTAAAAASVPGAVQRVEAATAAASAAAEAQHRLTDAAASAASAVGVEAPVSGLVTELAVARSRADGERRQLETDLATRESLHAELAALAALDERCGGSPAALAAALGAFASARAALDHAVAGHDGAQRSAADARMRLEAARATNERLERELVALHARVVATGAPASLLDTTTSLAQRWEVMATWCAGAATHEEAAIAAIEAQVADRRSDAARRRAVVDQRVAVAGVPESGPDVAASVLAALTVGRSQAEAVEVRARRADEIRARIDQREREQSLANALGRFLRADRFETWLLDDVMHQLVEGANATLAELTGGQFTLASRSGDFTVIDHRNADQERSARTLSGGETFLASLALALSLAEQLVSYGGGAGGRLEALFLDEGFGTLDPDTLDVVATAIEELGSRGRMIGLVSHVAELAARVPVRFEVRKDATTSVIDKVLQ